MITLENVTKTFGTGESALTDVTLTIENGEFVFLVGPSGSGKTTFFRLLIRDILPTTGTVTVNEMNTSKLAKGKIPHLRREIGVVFQDLKLLTDRTIFENIVLPLYIAGMESKAANVRAEEVLSQVGILEHKQKFPVQLSGGELQRVAIARAIIFTPKILLADEPTGNLDSVTSWEIVKLLQDINAAGTTVLMATHNTDIVKSLGKRVVTLEKGKIVSDVPAKKSEKKADEEKKDEEEHKEKKSHTGSHDKKHEKEEKE